MMEHSETVLLPLSREEALELFSRCLRSDEEDNANSEAVMKKLAGILAKMPAQHHGHMAA